MLTVSPPTICAHFAEVCAPIELNIQKRVMEITHGQCTHCHREDSCKGSLYTSVSLRLADFLHFIMYSD